MIFSRVKSGPRLHFSSAALHSDSYFQEPDLIAFPSYYFRFADTLVICNSRAAFPPQKGATGDRTFCHLSDRKTPLKLSLAKSLSSQKKLTANSPIRQEYDNRRRPNLLRGSALKTRLELLLMVKSSSPAEAGGPKCRLKSALLTDSAPPIYCSFNRLPKSGAPALAGILGRQL